MIDSIDFDWEPVLGESESSFKPWSSVYRGPSGTLYVRTVLNAVVVSVIAVSPDGTPARIFGDGLCFEARKAVARYERSLLAPLEPINGSVGTEPRIALGDAVELYLPPIGWVPCRVVRFDSDGWMVVWGSFRGNPLSLYVHEHSPGLRRLPADLRAPMEGT